MKLKHVPATWCHGNISPFRGPNHLSTHSPIFLQSITTMTRVQILSSAHLEQVTSAAVQHTVRNPRTQCTVRYALHAHTHTHTHTSLHICTHTHTHTHTSLHICTHTHTHTHTSLHICTHTQHTLTLRHTQGLLCTHRGLIQDLLVL